MSHYENSWPWQHGWREVVVGLLPTRPLLSFVSFTHFSSACGRSKVTKLLKQQGLSLTNPLGFVTGLPQSSTGCSFHLFLEPASITLFNTGDLQSCPKLLFPCPASLRHSWKKGGSGKMDLKTTNNEQQCKNGMLGIRMVLNTVSGRWDVRFQLCCALM